MKETIQSVPQATIEDVRNYWNNRPCNVKHSLEPIGTRAYFEQVEARKYFVEPHIPEFAQFDRWKGKRVLEIGCGIGTDAVNFARAGANYTGIDLSEESTKIASDRFKVFGLNGTIFACNAEDIARELPNNYFDLIYSFGVIHHSPNQRTLVEQSRKLIKKDGELRCMLYAKNSWKDAMIEAGLDQPEAESGCPIATTYSPEMVDELFRGLFEVFEMKQAHIFPYVIEKYVKYDYEIQEWFKHMPPAMFQTLERRFGWHMLITAVPV